MQRLLLFDIDGTLLQCGPQVRHIFATALEEVYGTNADLDGYDFAGKIDSQIVLELLEQIGLERSEILAGLAEMQERYVTRLEAELDAGLMTTLPGAHRVLTSLTAQPDIALCLLTGNWRRGAFTKLARLKLDDYFTDGAFGGDAMARPDLLPIALDRARATTGHRFDCSQTVIIGDSIHDVACGVAHNVPVLAVTTGWTPADQLAEAGATWIADSLDEGLAQIARA